MYPRQSGHYAYAPQQPSQYPSQPTQYYETSTDYYQTQPQQQPSPQSQYTISQSTIVPQFHVFTQPVAVYTQYPYQQQPPQPQPQQAQDQLYYNRQTAPTSIVRQTPQPAQSKQINQLNQPPEHIVSQYRLLPQQAQVSQISANPTHQILQPQSNYVSQPIKNNDKAGYPQSSMILTQIQSPSVYQQQPGQIQIPMRQMTNFHSQQQMQLKQVSQNTESQISSSIKQQLHFNQNEPPGCFDIIGRGNLPSVIFDSDVQLM